MRDRILDLLAGAGSMPRGEITAESRLTEDLLIDSISLLQLVLELEAESGRRFDDDRLAAVKTVGDVFALAGITE